MFLIISLFATFALLTCITCTWQFFYSHCVGCENANIHALNWFRREVEFIRVGSLWMQIIGFPWHASTENGFNVQWFNQLHLTATILPKHRILFPVSTETQSWMVLPVFTFPPLWIGVPENCATFWRQIWNVALPVGFDIFYTWSAVLYEVPLVFYTYDPYPHDLSPLTWMTHVFRTSRLF